MKTYDYYLKEVGEVGYVESVLHSMVYATGLPKARVMELVVTETGQRGIVQSLEKDYVEILMLDGRPVRHGTSLVRTGQILEIPVGDELLGRSVDPFVNPIDGKGPFRYLKETVQFENEAPPISRRAIITDPFYTGVTIVDLMVPLGKGQRELVLGDAKSGKTALLLQAMTEQAQHGTICIYVAIGQKKATIKRIYEYFQKTAVADRVIIVAADASSPASFIYLVPFTGMSIAEYFRDSGRDVLLIFDNLNTHAKLYREIALLSKKTPGREAYPGDIFYLHSHLLERAGYVKLKDGKTAAITLLGTVETVATDITGYIQTNSMSMSDGHIFFDSNLFHQGMRPAVSVPMSVSRVGHQTQTKLARSFSDWLRTVLTEYDQAQNYARFGVELTDKTKQILVLGDQVLEVFHQDQNTIVPYQLQLLYFGLLNVGYWTGAATTVIRADKALLAEAYEKGELTEVMKQATEAPTAQEYAERLKPYMATTIATINKRPYKKVDETVKVEPENTAAPEAIMPQGQPVKEIEHRASLWDRVRGKG